MALAGWCSPAFKSEANAPASDEANIDASSITFTWTGEPGASYEFQLATDLLFETIVADSLLTETSVQIDNIISEQGYFWRVRASNAAGASDWSTVYSFNVTTQVDIEDEQPNVSTLLHPAYPNPFQHQATIAFDLQHAGHYVDLDVFDLNGRRVTTLLSRVLPAGFHQANWDGRDIQGRPMASGVYVIRLRVVGALQEYEVHSQLLTLISN